LQQIAKASLDVSHRLRQRHTAAPYHHNRMPGPGENLGHRMPDDPVANDGDGALSFGVAMMAAPFATGDRTETDQLRHVLWRRSLPGRFSAQANR
jgi:hypothetical protein